MDPHSLLGYSTVASVGSQSAGTGILNVQSGDGARFQVGQNCTVWPASPARPLYSNAMIIRITTKSGDQLGYSYPQEGSQTFTIGIDWQIDNSITPKVITDIENLLNGALVSSIVPNEVPAGTMNGSNKSFTTAATFQSGSLIVFHNGQRLKQVIDYVEKGNLQGFDFAAAYTAPLSSDELVVMYFTNTTVFGVGSASFVYNQLANESPDSSRVIFTFPFAYVGGSIQVFLNGRQLFPGVSGDYTESNPATGQITFNSPAPLTGARITAHFQKSLSVAGNADLVDGYHANSTPTLNTIPVLDSNARMPAGSVGVGSMSVVVGSGFNGFRVYINAASVSGWANNAFTRVPFDTAEFDIDSLVDLSTNKGRFTAPVTGYYWFAAFAAVATSITDGTRLIISLHVNGSEKKRGSDYSIGATGSTPGGAVTDILKLNVGDYVEVMTYQNSGGSISWQGTIPFAFSGYRIR